VARATRSGRPLRPFQWFGPLAGWRLCLEVDGCAVELANGLGESSSTAFTTWPKLSPLARFEFFVGALATSAFKSLFLRLSGALVVSGARSFTTAASAAPAPSAPTGCLACGLPDRFDRSDRFRAIGHDDN
jgi:hypothetical protein